MAAPSGELFLAASVKESLILFSTPKIPAGLMLSGGDQSRVKEKPRAKPRPAGFEEMDSALGNRVLMLPPIASAREPCPENASPDHLRFKPIIPPRNLSMRLLLSSCAF